MEISGKGGSFEEFYMSRGRRDGRGGVEEVDAEAEGLADGGEGVAVGDMAEDVTERGGTEADAADLEAGVTKLSPFQRRLHGRWIPQGLVLGGSGKERTGSSRWTSIVASRRETRRGEER